MSDNPKPENFFSRHPVVCILGFFPALFILYVIHHEMRWTIRGIYVSHANEYLQERCTDGGEFIYRSVDNVDGFVLLRLRDPTLDLYNELRKGKDKGKLPDDPYGHSTGVHRAPERMFVGPKYGHYWYMERPESYSASITDTPALDTSLQDWVRYYWDPVTDQEPGPLQLEEPTSRYAVLWRAFATDEDRSKGVHGGETLVIDRHTQARSKHCTDRRHGGEWRGDDRSASHHRVRPCTPRETLHGIRTGTLSP